MGGGGLGGELGHLLDGCGVEVTAWAVLFPQKAGVLAAVSAVAGRGLDESNYRHWCGLFASSVLSSRVWSSVWCSIIMSLSL